MMRKPSASPESYSGTMWGWARLAAMQPGRVLCPAGCTSQSGDQKGYVTHEWSVLGGLSLKLKVDGLRLIGTTDAGCVISPISPAPKKHRLKTL